MEEDLDLFLQVPNDKSKMELLSKQPLQNLFGALQSNSTSQQLQEKICDALGYIFAGDSGLELLLRDEVFVILPLAFNHPNLKLGHLVLREMERIPDLNKLKSHGLLLSCVQALGNKNSTFAERSKQTIIQMCKSRESAVDVLFDGEELTTLKGLVNSHDEITKLRTLETMIAIDNLSPNAATHADKTGWLDVLMYELKKPDLLVQLNVVELLSQLRPERAHEDQLLSLLRETANEFTIAVRVLACVARHLAKREDETPLLLLGAFVNTVVAYIGDRNQDFKEGAASAISLMCSSRKGTLAFVNNGGDQVIIHLVDMAVSRDDSLRIAGASTLGQFLHFCPQNNENLGKEIFDAIEPYMNRLIECVKQPLVEQRSAILSLFNELAEFDWGLAMMCTREALLDYLMDRRVESTKQPLEMKHQVVQKLMSRPNVASMLTEAQMRKIREFLQSGPYYTAGTTDLTNGAVPTYATKGAS